MDASNKTLIQEFYTSFQASQSDLSARLAVLKAEGNAPQDAINALALDVAKLRKDLSDANAYLPSYDLRQYEQSLKSLEQSLDDLRTASAGKPKFSFKRKPAKTSACPSGPHPATTSNVASSSWASANSIVLSGHTRQRLTWSSVSSVSASTTDLSVTDLDSCIVDLCTGSASDAFPSLTAVHMRNVKNSIVILPHVKGSAMVHDMSNSVLAVGCHQFRMHTSTSVDVYFHIDSNPIIEHCTKLRFAPFPAALVEVPTPPAAVPNLSVQDFSHIRATPSPNWSVLPDEDYLRQEDWNRITTPDAGDLCELLQNFLSKSQA
ncbi:TBCC-domain-containing protein [Phanerochaete sordida]|uniref:TBCC-domain-containing protein n=1 Tax=Phanerochaete sordida TaxID=48140 RepID=A0A9P3G196_9APHY|nr:TBCC-domain-containing protein [Phanerochaete sordida]